MAETMAVPTAADAGFDATRHPEGTTRRLLRRLLRNRMAVVALAFLFLLLLIALLAPVIAPHDPNEQVLADRLQGPSFSHPLGTDEVGRDVMSRLFVATRTSVLAAALAVLVAIIGGVPAGLAAAHWGGWFDSALSRFADAVMSIPALVLALALVAVFEPNLRNAMLAVGLVYAPRLFRVVRGSALGVGAELFMEASHASGMPARKSLVLHVLPNVLPALVVQISLALGFAIVAEASLSFLGLGVQPPNPSWGTMLGNATRFVEQAPFLAIVPGVTITLAVLAFNIVGDALQDSVGKRRERGEG
jgi:peptide/nickel transport system permease protein